MNVLVTGAHGFIAKNLIVHLEHASKDQVKIYEFGRSNTLKELADYIKDSDFIFHLAGENRPADKKDYLKVNYALTAKICELCHEYNPIPILFASSVQAELQNEYGVSKLTAEKVLERYSATNNVPVYNYRLLNVFGKWVRPNYNSFVATMCHNMANDLPIDIDCLDKKIHLVYIDDVVTSFIDAMKSSHNKSGSFECKLIEQVYIKSLGEIRCLLEMFHKTPKTLLLPQAFSGFERALYASYISYLAENKFSYPIKDYTDDRGSFYEVLKTRQSGQVSVSTTKPGITRGNHFHHSKVEKFLVIKGKAIFRFRHLITGELISIQSDESKKRVIEVPAGYTHNFTNIGEDELIILLWANEIFDVERPDTYYLEV